MGANLVVHAAAALPLYSRRDIFSTDVEGTGNLLEASLRAGVERFVHISSTAVYGIPDRHPLYEDDKLAGVGPYGEAKIRAEELCERYRARGMCVPIIRPKSFVGPERLGVFALLYDWARDGRGFPVIGSGNNRYQLIRRHLRPVPNRAHHGSSRKVHRLGRLFPGRLPYPVHQS